LNYKDMKYIKLYPQWGNTTRCYEDFDWSDEDFDYEEEKEEDLPDKWCIKMTIYNKKKLPEIIKRYDPKLIYKLWGWDRDYNHTINAFYWKDGADWNMPNDRKEIDLETFEKILQSVLKE